MEKAAFMAEIRMLAIRAALLDLSAYLISTFFYGFTLRFALGLLLGTAVMVCNLLLLQRGLSRVVYEAKREGKADIALHTRYYIYRLAVFSAAFALSLLLPTVFSPIAAVIPVFYPKLIYTAQGFFKKTQSPK